MTYIGVNEISSHKQPTHQSLNTLERTILSNTKQVNSALARADWLARR